MAILIALPAQAIIAGFKGTVDFYQYMGLACARAWPKSPGKIRSGAVQAQWPGWGYAAREWNNLSPEVQASYKAFTFNGGLDGRDLQMRAYLSGIYRNPYP